MFRGVWSPLKIWRETKKKTENLARMEPLVGELSFSNDSLMWNNRIKVYSGERLRGILYAAQSGSGLTHRALNSAQFSGGGGGPRSIGPASVDTSMRSQGQRRRSSAARLLSPHTFVECRS